ncbi:hypothetical protein EDB19DRAFT_1189412 [Suillus lakei]|nr:hypothetical protein EDB19DRAFT_1189412 [Suillus lakei]
MQHPSATPSCQQAEMDCWVTLNSGFHLPTLSPTQYIVAGVEEIVENIVGPFAKEPIKDLEQSVHSKHDAYSFLSFMSFEYTPSTSLPIPRCLFPPTLSIGARLFENSPGSYDHTLIELVLKVLAFAFGSEFS